MKIVTWNINSVRARIDRLVDFLKTRDPDVLCLQELKCTDDQFPRAEVEALGYQAVTFGQKAYNGVAILSKTPITNVLKNLGDDDEESRVIAGNVNGVRIVNLYAPNGQSLTSPAYTYKLEWYARLGRWLAGTKEKLLVCGDFNIAPAEMDTHDPVLWSNVTLASPKERAAFQGLLATNSLIDVFRHKHPDDGRFTWWDYRAGAFHKNLGLRIDHFLVSRDLIEKVTAIDIDRDARKGKLPSDHAPVWLELQA